MIQFARHHARWNIIGPGLIVLVTGYVVELVSDVIFGEEGDHILLGVHTLEGLGLSPDPLKRE